MGKNYLIARLLHGPGNTFRLDTRDRDSAAVRHWRARPGRLLRVETEIIETQAPASPAGLLVNQPQPHLRPAGARRSRITGLRFPLFVVPCASQRTSKPENFRSTAAFPLVRSATDKTFRDLTRLSEDKMRTEWERSTFKRAALARFAESREREEDPRGALAPLFHGELAAHPEEEDLLLELWDQLTGRPVL